ncbi:MAG: TIGR03546 family protein [Desulfobacterales bacterium]|nr:TIGR03546 family protein [Desulfobacterales bacterium]
MIDMIAKLLKILNSESEPGQISIAFCLAMIAGFTPFYSLHNLLILLLVLIFRINLSGFILGWALFSGCAYLLDPVFHRIGYALLTMPSLKGLWTAFYNIVLLRLENFNNTVVMGSFMVSILLFIPLYFLLNCAHSPGLRQSRPG